MSVYPSPGKCLKFLYLLIIAFAVIPAGCAAFQIAVDEQLHEVATEGATIDFNLFVTNIHQGASQIIIDTDLYRADDIPLFSVNELEVVSNETPFSISVPDDGVAVTVQIHGQIPRITTVAQPGPVTLTLYDKKRTGYAYYRVTLADDKGNPVPGSDTRVFSIDIPEIDRFREKTSSISDPFMSSYLQDLFDKGLVSEAGALADYELARDGQIPTVWAVGAVCIAAVVAFVIGIRIGGRDGVEGEE